MSVYAFMETLEEKHTKMSTVLPDIFTAFFFFAYLSVCVCVMCGVWLCVHVLCACIMCGVVCMCYVWCLGVCPCVVCACMYTGACTVLVSFNCQLEII